MVNQETAETINKLIAGYLTENSFDLIELILRHESGVLAIHLFVDLPQGGITLDECAGINRRIVDIFDTNNILPENYTLEVSSPGLDRRLKTQADFSRCLGKEVVFFLNDLVGGKCQWQGYVNKVDETGVTIDSCKQVLTIPLIKINKAQLVIKK